MAVKYQIRTVVDKSIKDRVAELMKFTGHSESKQTKILIDRALEMEGLLREVQK